MRSRLAVLLTACLVGSPLTAQDRPDLSGTWTLDPSRSESLASGAQPPTTLTIRHAVDELTIDADRNGRHDVMTYQFERSRSPEAEERRVGKWSWDGSKVLTDRIAEVQDKTVTARQTFSLTASGAELVVETLVEVQHGYTLRGTKNYATAKDVYTRATPRETRVYSCRSASIGSSCDARLAG